MRTSARNLLLVVLSLAIPISLVSFGLAKGAVDVGVPIGSYLCTGTQCTGTGGCRPTPKFGGSANYRYRNPGKCEWTIWPYSTCSEQRLVCYTITYYDSENCSGNGTTYTEYTIGC